jgi:hypothetical protein
MRRRHETGVALLLEVELLDDHRLQLIEPAALTCDQ